MSSTIDKHETQILSAHKEDTPPDSVVLFIPIDKGVFNPKSPRNFPGERTLNMPKEPANELAVTLNRLVLEKYQGDVPHWNVVLYVDKGVCVGRVPIVQKWTPEDEYATPPSTHAGLTNTEARRVILDFNTKELYKCQFKNRWAIHVKPLTRPEIKYGPTVCTREMDRSELNEMEQEISDVLYENLRGFSRTKTVEIEVDGSSLGTHVQFPKGWDKINIHSVPPHEVAMILRDQAGQLLQAAAKLSREPIPQLSIGQPFHEVCIEDNDYVSLMLMNCESEQEAIQRASQFLTRLKHSEKLVSNSTADAA